ERRGGVRATAWIDAAGHVVRAMSGGDGGFTMERSAFEIAYENFRRRDTARVARASASPRVGDIVATTALAAGARPRAAPLAELRVRLTGGDAGPLVLAAGRQRLAGDTLVVRRQTAAPPTCCCTGSRPRWRRPPPCACPPRCRCSRDGAATATSTRCCTSRWRAPWDCRLVPPRGSCWLTVVSTITPGPRCIWATGSP